MLACNKTNLRLNNGEKRYYSQNLQMFSLNSTPTLPKPLFSTFHQHTAEALLANEKHICNFVISRSASRRVYTIVSYSFKGLRACVFCHESKFPDAWSV